MTRRIKRLPKLDLALQIKDPNFIRPPREAQRNWLLNRAVGEFIQDLESLDQLSKRFVPGTEEVPLDDRSQTDLVDEQIMEDWQIQIMRKMAELVCKSGGDILEIGFGRGISANFIQEQGVRSHTIVEVSDPIVKRFETWKAAYPQADIRMVHGRWQDVTAELGSYDGVFFHTYPLDEQEYVDNVVDSITFAAHFFPTASAHLKPGGVFTYLTNEIDSFSRAHQRLLFQHFNSITLQIVEPLNLPEDIQDAWWADSMVVVQAVK
jgi:guanidinoacetate N-methyltransferase